MALTASTRNDFPLAGIVPFRVYSFDLDQSCLIVQESWMAIRVFFVIFWCDMEAVCLLLVRFIGFSGAAR